jgi:hypothetical protein
MIYDMITKEDKIFIINAYLKELSCDKYVLNNKIKTDSTENEIAEINSKIFLVDQKIQAIESEKTNINEGE